MIKLENLLKEVEQEKLEEAGAKDIFTAVALMVSSLFSPDAAGQSKADKPAIAQAVKQADSSGMVQRISDTSIQINVGKFFGSGKYKLKDKDLIKQLDAAIAAFMVQHPDADFDIEVISSESKVPNYDGEAGVDFSKLTSDQKKKYKLDDGELSILRADEVESVLSALENVVEKKGLVKGNINISRTDLGVQGPEWDGTSKDAEKYTKNQFVKVNVTAHNKTKKTPTDYAAYGNEGEIYHKQFKYSKEAVAVAFYDTRTTKDPKDPGYVNPSYQEVLLKTVKRNTPLVGTKNEKGVYTATYLIPWKVWNSTVDPSHELTDDDLEVFQDYKVN